MVTAVGMKDNVEDMVKNNKCSSCVSRAEACRPRAWIR